MHLSEWTGTGLGPGVETPSRVRQLRRTKGRAVSKCGRWRRRLSGVRDKGKQGAGKPTGLAQVWGNEAMLDRALLVLQHTDCDLNNGWLQSTTNKYVHATHWEQ